MRIRHWHRALSWSVWLAGMGLAGSLWAQPRPRPGMSGMPDPRMMSGIPRVDPGLESGAVSVRALLGSFAQPAVDHEITLKAFSADNKALGTLSSQSDGAGRVTFRQLFSRYPDVAYVEASATLDGNPERTRRIPLSKQAGSRVLLVKGASAVKQGQMPPGAPGAGMQNPHAPGGAGQNPHAPGVAGQNPHAPGVAGQNPHAPGVAGQNPHAPGGAGQNPHAPGGAGQNPHAPGAAGQSPHGQAGNLPAPALCKPNDLSSRPDGTLVVGLVSFSGQGKLLGRPKQTVTLSVTVPGQGPGQTLEAITDENGRATFTGLTGAAYPEGTRFRLRAPAEPGTQAPGAFKTTASGDAGLAPFKVRVQVQKPGATQLWSDSFEWTQKAKVVLLTRNCAKTSTEPVTGLKVALARHSMTGDKSQTLHELNDKGEVEIDLQGHHDGDFYTVGVNYQGAPFRSGFFQPPPAVGVAAKLAVYDITDDPSQLRSAVQFEFYSREDNMAQVNRYYQVFVPGAKAFWSPGLRIQGPKDTRWFKVVPSAESNLKHDEGAPFATLAAPILPGAPIDLSVAYGVPHGGELSLNWQAPFPLERAMGVSTGEIEIVSGTQGPASQGQHQGAQGTKLWQLVLQNPGARLCSEGAGCEGPQKPASVNLVLSGFAYELPWLLWAGGAVGGIALLAIMAGWWQGRREDPRAAWLAQRDQLWQAMRRAEASGDEAGKRQLLLSLNALYHRAQALPGDAGSQVSSRAAAGTRAGTDSKASSGTGSQTSAGSGPDSGSAAGSQTSAGSSPEADSTPASSPSTAPKDPPA